MLYRKGPPYIFIELISNWYSKLSSRVKWNDSLSESLMPASGVMQGAILARALFNIYVDSVSNDLQKSKLGCHFMEYMLSVSCASMIWF